jgi:hypothetical protein
MVTAACDILENCMARRRSYTMATPLQLLLPLIKPLPARRSSSSKLIEVLPHVTDVDERPSAPVIHSDIF